MDGLETVLCVKDEKEVLRGFVVYSNEMGEDDEDPFTLYDLPRRSSLLDGDGFETPVHVDVQEGPSWTYHPV